MTIVLVAAIILGNVLLWVAFSNRGAQKTETAAETPPLQAVKPASAATEIASMPAPVSVQSPVPAAESFEPPAATNAVIAVTTITNAPEPAPAVVFENPKPAPLRLQSIIYNPARPSAMIGGKFLFIGDSIQGFRVTAIGQEAVTLIGGGQTNVLSLP